MQPNYDKYRSYLTPRKLTTQQENELMDFVWNFMESQIDHAFGHNPVRLAIERSDKSSLQSPELIVSKNSSDEPKPSDTIH